MTFDDYKFICFCHKIDTNVIEACREFAEKEAKWFGELGVADDDLGFAELRDIVTKADSLKKVANNILMSTLDYDSLGRKMTKVRTKQLIKKPHKGLLRQVLKSYYLHYHNL